MTATRKAAKKPLLRVVFDTNVLFTGTASDFLQSAAVETIKAHSGHADLVVEWYIPNIVVLERRYQMEKKGKELLPGIQKMERLLGHNLALTETVVAERVSAVISAQISELSVQVLALDPTRVNWPRLVEDSAYRNPPFDTGEKEKGFRDAIVGETFLQLVEDSPSTPQSCRLALVTGDELLSDMVGERVKARSNVRILASHEALKELINTLVAEIDEEFVARLHPLASALFFVADDKSTLYYQAEVFRRIKRDFAAELSQLPSGADARVHTRTLINPPRFVRKVKQRVYWASRVTLNYDAQKIVTDTAPLPNVFFSALQKGSEGGGSFVLPWEIKTSDQPQLPISISSQTAKPAGLEPSSKAELTYLPQTLLTTPTRTTVRQGRSIFEVVWSVTVSTAMKLTSPALEEISLVETSWD